MYGIGLLSEERNEKIENADQREKIKKQCEYENPNAPWEKTAATVFRKIFEQKVSKAKSELVCALLRIRVKS